MFTPTDDKPTANTTQVIDGAIQVWDPALWAAYLDALVQDERKRKVN